MVSAAEHLWYENLSSHNAESERFHLVSDCRLARAGDNETSTGEVDHTAVHQMQLKEAPVTAKIISRKFWYQYPSSANRLPMSEWPIDTWIKGKIKIDKPLPAKILG